jgi:hypothetical protein
VPYAVIPLIVASGTCTEACKKAKLSRDTLYERLKIAEFRTELERQRDEVTQDAFGLLSHNLTKAVETLTGLLDDNDKRLKRFAAKDVIDYFIKQRELDSLEQRIEAIEQRLEKR